MLAWLEKWKDLFIEWNQLLLTSFTSIVLSTDKKYLVAKNIEGDMEEALNTAIHVINFAKSNSVNDRFFVQFC